MNVTALFKLTNVVLEAAIVTLISSVLLYGIRTSIRSRVARATNLLMFFTVIAYLGDLFLTQVTDPAAMQRWLRAEWLGIAFVPSAYLHLSSTLLELTDSRQTNRWRRLGVILAYCLSAASLALSALTDLLVRGDVSNLEAPQLLPGPLFPLFALLFGAIIVIGVSIQIRARNQSRTATTRRRITYLIASAIGPVISVFPYLVITGQNTIIPAPLFWVVQIIGNGIVGITIFFMTYSVAFLGGHEPDRVVRLRLIKFLARGPLVAIGVMILLVIVDRTGRFLGLSSSRATPFVVVAGIVFFQWIILLIKPALERWFYFDERDQVVRLQELRDRVMTTQDLHQFLENVLASVCELLQVETAFVASYSADGEPQVELIVGQLELSEELTQNETWDYLKLDAQKALPGQSEEFAWNGYHIITLANRAQDRAIGILGLHTPQAWPQLGEEFQERLGYLAKLAAAALEDRLLQHEVFAAMEGLLLQVQATEQDRQAIAQDGSRPLQGNELITQDDFANMVRDALSHYWGGPKLTQSPLLRLQVVRQEVTQHQGSSVNAMRAILLQGVESLRPEGSRSMTTAEWILYNILEMKFLKGYKVRDIARRLAMSESDLYRKQRIAIEAVARSIAAMEKEATLDADSATEIEPNGSKSKHKPQQEELGV